MLKLALDQSNENQMKRDISVKYPLMLAMALFLVSFSCVRNDQAGSEKDDIYVAAYVWPSCHYEERNAEILWPEGTGEWEIIRKGTPRFAGHYQPKVPLWGYEMDDDPGVMEKWIETATGHGVNVFIFDWYWFDGGPFLESSIDNGFLQAKNNEKMNFYIMWANHDVKKNYWNHYKYDSDSLLWTGSVDQENYRIIVDRVIRQYFHRPNYFKIDGKPVFSIFNFNKFIQDFNGLEGAREALDYFRSETIKAGFPGLHLQIIAFGGNEGNPGILMDHLMEGKNNSEIVSYLGINSVTKYNWGQGEGVEDYIVWGEQAMKRRKNWDEALDIPYFPNVSIGWDDTPRFPAKTEANVIHYHNSPESFAAYLQRAEDYLDAHPDQPRLITLFSWNEWVEGGYLLPDMRWGYGYLEAVDHVINRKRGRQSP
jgi:hypothetical protein